ncbi:ribbon-helix-helix protein, CopG family [Candidatus Thorarchaeota archaeon]|jgi:Arc/MetJ-type ribon-helix-helix transcriptional regulator|nr:MAG: ribbon-helix-helix protein, CopG family [Candidatus Thorarchaeota archaeon]
MRLIAVHLPDRIVEDIQELVEKGLYPNRSEAIRIAIRDLLKRELWNENTRLGERVSEAVGQ